MRNRILRVGPADFSPRLVIFDKDGTLIDLNYMWAPWILDLGKRLDSISGLSVSPSLFRCFGFDASESRLLANGALAVSSMAALHELAVDVLNGAGLEREAAENATDLAWNVPDPLLLARALDDLPRVFGTLAAAAVKTAVATSDDRLATIKTLDALGIAQMVDFVIGADDGGRIKPAPDMVFKVCSTLGVQPMETVVIGDAVADMRMGRSAGAGLMVGVLSGVSSRGDIAPYADVVISSVGDLV